MCHIIFSNISILCFVIFILEGSMAVVKGSKKLVTSTKEQRKIAPQMWYALEQSKRIQTKSISPRIDDRSNSSRIDASGNISVYECSHSKYVNVERPNATFIITSRSFPRDKRSSNNDNRFNNTSDNELYGDKHLRDVNNGIYTKSKFNNRGYELYKSGGKKKRRVMDEEVQQEVNEKVTKKAEDSKEITVSSYKSMSSSMSQAVLRQGTVDSLKRDISNKENENKEPTNDTESEVKSDTADAAPKDLALLQKLEELFIKTGDYIILVLLKALKERFRRLKVSNKFWTKVNETSTSGGKTHAEVKETLADNIKEQFNESFKNKLAELLGILATDVTIQLR